MTLVSTTEDLAAFCRDAAEAPYVTVDTEFLRERTYYPELCLVQLARPGKGADTAVVVDALAPGIDLAPLYELMRRQETLKVFHAARQDIEIFWLRERLIPEPFFDTQVAAMVCGYGDQVGYDTLVRQIVRAAVDKSSRFTDWSRRPLSQAQLAYALADVTHLRQIYERLSGQLKKTGRDKWVEEELSVLTDPETYASDPAQAWLRLKFRSTAPRFLAAARELARFREELAQRRNVPRNRILKDDALLELAAARPASADDLGRARLLQRDARRGEIADGILAAIRKAEAIAPQDMPAAPESPARRTPGAEALGELLRVLLKARAEASGVASKLIASSADLDAIAAGEVADVPALTGWRHEIFGADALRLTRGEIALSARGNSVMVVELPAADVPGTRRASG
jgi:ribonuclease D